MHHYCSSKCKSLPFPKTDCSLFASRLVAIHVTIPFLTFHSSSLLFFSFSHPCNPFNPVNLVAPITSMPMSPPSLELSSSSFKIQMKKFALFTLPCFFFSSKQYKPDVHWMQKRDKFLTNNDIGRNFLEQCFSFSTKVCLFGAKQFCPGEKKQGVGQMRRMDNWPACLPLPVDGKRKWK